MLEMIAAVDLSSLSMDVLPPATLMAPTLVAPNGDGVGLRMPIALVQAVLTPGKWYPSK